MIINWIIATYKPSGISLLRVGGCGTGVSCVVCFGFAVSSNVNGVIKAILNIFIFFTKRFCKHKKYKNHKKHKRPKSANKPISNFLSLRCFKCIKKLPLLFLFACMRFVLFVRANSCSRKKKTSLKLP